MLRKLIAILFIGVLLIFLTGSGKSISKGGFVPFYPSYFPSPDYDFINHPLDSTVIELGRKLFYDPILSLDGTISCSSCHLSYTGFTHVDHALSHGIGDSIGRRNAPALINLAWNENFMWDGAVNHIEVQALAPIEHPSEMGEQINHVIQKLQQSNHYPSLFYNAFNDSSITGEYFLKALAQFQLTLVSVNSTYDKVKAGKAEFSVQEQNGYTLFQKHCNECHSEPLFTNGQFINNGLLIDSLLMDYGRGEVTLKKEDSLKFKVPTLRNIEFTYPYMHDGRFQELSEVLHYYCNDSVRNTTVHSSLRNRLSLSSNEQVDLIAFLLTLTDKGFLFNPKFAFPK